MIAPANTGSDNSNNNAVIPTAQTNKGIRSGFKLIDFMVIIVEMKFTAPRIDDTTADESHSVGRKL